MKQKQNSFFNTLLLLLGPLIIITGVWFFLHNYRDHQKEINTKTAEHIIELFDSKLKSYIFGLQGMGGVYRIKNFSPTREEISAYAISRNNFTNFDGSLGFGFIRKVPSRELDKYIYEKKKNDQDFHYKKLFNAPTEDHLIIENVEPRDVNRHAIGLDISTEENRNATAIESGTLGAPIITKELQLIQMTNEGPGYHIYLPIYKTPNTPTSREERKKSLIGFAYTPILSSKVVDYTKKEIPNDIQFSIKQKKSGAYFFSNFSQDQRFTYTKNVTLLGKEWEWKFYFPKTRSATYVEVLSYLLGFILSLAHILFIFYLQKLKKEKLGVEKKYLEIENWQKTILDNIPLSIISTDTNGTILTINKAGRNMLGYTEVDLIDKSSPIIIHDVEEVVKRAEILSKEYGITVEPGIDTFTHTTKQGNADINEWTYIKKDGSRFPVRLIVTALFDSENRIVGYVGIAEDISEIKKMEDIIEEQEMNMMVNSKLMALGEMASGIAHEINNPLTALHSKISYISSRIERKDISPEQIQSEFSQIEKTIFRISKIVSGLKAISRDTRNDPLESCDLSSIVEDTLSLCIERFKNHNILLETDLIKGADVMALPAQISQVLLNLLNNSHDAIENFEIKWIKVSMEITIHDILIKVSDSGPKLKEDVIEKIFNPFYTTKAVGKGTGLGLSISKNILIAHKGELYYDNKAPHNTFVMKLKR